MYFLEKTVSDSKILGLIFQTWKLNLACNSSDLGKWLWLQRERTAQSNLILVNEHLFHWGHVQCSVNKGPYSHIPTLHNNSAKLIWLCWCQLIDALWCSNTKLAWEYFKILKKHDSKIYHLFTIMGFCLFGCMDDCFYLFIYFGYRGGERLNSDFLFLSMTKIKEDGKY